jgi:predicted anti-sigma-YlaC factor YlaD
VSGEKEDFGPAMDDATRRRHGTLDPMDCATECATAREILSADLDHEAGALEARAAHRHVDECADCRNWYVEAERLHRRWRVRPAEAVPDLTDLILERSHPARPGRGEWVRYSLAVVALTQLAVALPWLFAGNEPGTTIHESRHIGAMSVALALGLLYTVKNPTRAYGIFPITAALALTMSVSALVDVIRGSTPLLGESIHVLEVLGFVLVWMLAGRPGVPRWVRRAPRSVGQPGASARDAA